MERLLRTHVDSDENSHDAFIVRLLTRFVPLKVRLTRCDVKSPENCRQVFNLIEDDRNGIDFYNTRGPGELTA